jgi:hypothetical protein
VRSYAKIKGGKFTLCVYSNWVSSSLKRRYFPRWRKFSFVEIVEPEWYSDETKPTDRRLERPFERCDTIWDRELRKIDRPYYATVDADVEILDGRFVPVMLAQLDSNPNLVAMATDYSPAVPEHYDSYSDQIIRLNQRWHTWFCIYKRETLQCQIPHAYRRSPIRGRAARGLGYYGLFSKALKENYGFQLGMLDPKYQPCFIHYGAFSKNRNINAWNVGLYRRLQSFGEEGFSATTMVWLAKWITG